MIQKMYEDIHLTNYLDETQWLLCFLHGNKVYCIPQKIAQQFFCISSDKEKKRLLQHSLLRNNKRILNESLGGVRAMLPPMNVSGISERK